MLRYFADGKIHWKERMRCNRRTNWEFYAVIEGRCAAALRDTEFPTLRERTLWVFAPECPHAWVDDGRRSYHRISMHFSSVPYPLDEIVRARGGFLLKELSDDEIEDLRSIASELETHFCRPVTVSLLHFQRRLIDLTLLALREVKEAGESLDLTEVAMLRVERALAWYGANLSRQPTVRQVADHIHVSTSHFRRLCAGVRGASPKELMRRIRLEKAQDIMGRTDCTLDEIAARCGYSGASHFCREYKTSNGFTPSTWRHRLVDRFSRPIPAGFVPVREYSARKTERSLRA